jgi:hypothetical protein
MPSAWLDPHQLKRRLEFRQDILMTAICIELSGTAISLQGKQQPF